MSPEMMPILPFFSGIENRYLEGWDRFGFSIFAAAVGAANTSVRIRNPQGSNVVAVIEGIQCFSGPQAGPLADAPFVGYKTLLVSNLANVQTSNYIGLDARGRAQPTVIISSGSGIAAGLVSIMQVAYGANGFVQFIQHEEQEITLLPGSALDTIGNVLNQGITVSYMWRERFLEDSERS